MTSNLPRRQQQLYDLLAGKGDVPITAIFEGMNPGMELDAHGVRYMQQWLGKYITMLNRSLEERGLRVVPGELKNSYRLTVTR